MNYGIFKHIKGTDIIIADSILCLRSVHLYESSDLEREEEEFGHDIFKNYPS